MINIIKTLYPNRVVTPLNVEDIPSDSFMVYYLDFNNKPIVLGHGKKNRAKVILDNKDQITNSHIKALFVRLFSLYGKGQFNRCIIACRDKEEAKLIEKTLHQKIGGNTREVPPEIRDQLFSGLQEDSISKLILEIALRSSFDGLSDIKKWRADGLISDTVWPDISSRLQLK